MRLLNTFISLLIVTAASAQDTDLFKKMSYIDGNDTLNYRMLYPSKYDINKKYPVLLFLHGAGERGNDNQKQLLHGSSLFLDSANRVNYPSFVIVPQCPQSDFWARVRKDDSSPDSLGSYRFVSEDGMTRALTLAQHLMDSIVETPQVDPKQVYVGGLSMGGMGTFELLWRKPRFYTAAFAICGGGDPLKVPLYAKNFPIWVFHGAADSTVPVSNSRLMVKSLKAAGAKVEYTEYPGVGHNSWEKAFAEPALLSWLYSQKKTGRAPK